EAAILDLAGPGPFRALLDLGAGTGRTLELLSPRAERATGIDLNPAMLGGARARIERAGLRGVQLRQGDLYAAPAARDSFDLAIVHQVLHYLDDPARALREAARALAPGGRLIVVDFAPHSHEDLRTGHAHRRLGFGSDEVAGWLEEAGLVVARRRDIAPGADQPSALVVSLWLAVDPRRAADAPRATEIA
ncbi:MAG: methyltransferase domain-containing protein, partial [Hyphomicrobiales bacterium]|nr:methyltransferase domain-containing protein [Hyphomicrobiales bacterium]